MNLNRYNWLVLVFAMAMLPRTAVAQTTQLKSPVELSLLTDLVAKETGVRFIYAQQTVTGSVAIHTEGLRNDQLWSVFNDALSTRDLVTAYLRDGSYSIVRLTDAGTRAHVFEDLAALQSIDPAPSFGSMRLVLRSLSAATIATQAREVLASRGGTARQAPLTNAVILTGPLSAVVSLAEDIARRDSQLDRYSSFRYRSVALPIEILSQEVQQTLTEREAVGWLPPEGAIAVSADSSELVIFAPESAQDEWRDLIKDIDVPSVVTSRPLSAGRFPASDAVVSLQRLLGSHELPDLDVDELSNSIVARGFDWQIRAAESAMDRLLGSDDPRLSHTSSWYPVRHRTPADLVEVVEQLQQRTETVSVAADSADSPAPDTALHSTLPRFEPALLTHDSATNQIIVAGHPSAVARSIALLERLDVPQPQLMLETVLVALSEGESKDLGVQLERLTSNENTQFRLASIFGIGSIAPIAGSSFDAGQGFTASALNPGEFSVLVRALETVNEGRTTSMPKVLVSNNEQATFNSVLQQPFTSTNASDTVATTSFGGTQDAGTTVTVRPQITSGDQVTLEYSVSFSTFVGESSDPSIPPPRQQNQVQSVATVPDGYTVVVGGLEQLVEGDAISKIPLLGDIPGLGRLFQNRSRSESRTRFYVFLRASVLRRNGFEDLKYLSQSDLESAGVDSGMPVLEPRIIR